MDAEFLGSAAALAKFDGEPTLPRLIASRYRIDGPLAEGGMAVVFRGWHVLLERSIAIKVLKDEYLHNPEAVARFLREARATARLQGRHVAHVFDIGRINGRAPFMVTELLKGSDLGKLLAQGPFPPSRAVPTLLAICDAVQEVHAAGIVHRDLKPDNLFLVDEGSFPHVKILDFGVARPLRSNLTLPERGVGSPQYMSPEQILTPQQVDFQTDVWSLGVVLYELLTARLPFSAATIPALCSQIVRSDFARPSNWRYLPEDLREIICRCLAKDRQARYASVVELRQALAALRFGGSPRSAPPKRARPRLGLGLMLLTSVLAGGLTFAGVVVVFDRATAVTPRPDVIVDESMASLAVVPAEQPADGTEGPPPTVLQVSPVVEREGDDPADAAAARPAATARERASGRDVPLPAEPWARPAEPSASEGWLWLERDPDRPELAHKEIVSPYSSKRWPSR